MQPSLALCLCFVAVCSARFVLNVTSSTETVSSSLLGMRGTNKEGLSYGNIGGATSLGGNTDPCGSGVANQPRSARLVVARGETVYISGTVLDDPSGATSIEITYLAAPTATGDPNFATQTGNAITSVSCIGTNGDPAPCATGLGFSANILIGSVYPTGWSTMQFKFAPASGAGPYYQCVDLLAREAPQAPDYNTTNGKNFANFLGEGYYSGAVTVTQSSGPLVCSLQFQGGATHFAMAANCTDKSVLYVMGLWSNVLASDLSASGSVVVVNSNFLTNGKTYNLLLARTGVPANQTVRLAVTTLEAPAAASLTTNSSTNYIFYMSNMNTPALPPWTEVSSTMRWTRTSEPCASYYHSNYYHSFSMSSNNSCPNANTAPKLLLPSLSLGLSFAVVEDGWMLNLVGLSNELVSPQPVSYNRYTNMNGVPTLVANPTGFPGANSYQAGQDTTWTGAIITDTGAMLQGKWVGQQTQLMTGQAELCTTTVLEIVGRVYTRNCTTASGSSIVNAGFVDSHYSGHLIMTQFGQSNTRPLLFGSYTLQYITLRETLSPVLHSLFEKRVYPVMNATGSAVFTYVDTARATPSPSPVSNSGWQCSASLGLLLVALLAVFV